MFEIIKVQKSNSEVSGKSQFDLHNRFTLCLVRLRHHRLLNYFFQIYHLLVYDKTKNR